MTPAERAQLRTQATALDVLCLCTDILAACGQCCSSCPLLCWSARCQPSQAHSQSSPADAQMAGWLCALLLAGRSRSLLLRVGLPDCACLRPIEASPGRGRRSAAAARTAVASLACPPQGACTAQHLTLVHMHGNSERCFQCVARVGGRSTASPSLTAHRCRRANSHPQLLL